MDSGGKERQNVTLRFRIQIIAYVAFYLEDAPSQLHPVILPETFFYPVVLSISCSNTFSLFLSKVEQQIERNHDYYEFLKQLPPTTQLTVGTFV